MDSLPPQPGPAGLPPELPRPPRDVDWRERFDELRDQLVLAVPPWFERGRVVGLAVGAAVIAVAALVVTSWLRQPAAPPDPVIPMAVASDLVAPTPVPVDVVVHVAGAVVQSGVYTLAEGSRVADAVAAAGGVVADADLERANLAAVVADGQRVFIPLVDQPIPVVASGAGAGVPIPDAPQAPVELNTADQSELEALPGVGPATATAIIAYREETGGFRAVAELEEVPGIGPAKLQQIESLVTVG